MDHEKTIEKTEMEDSSVYWIKDLKLEPDVVHPYTSDLANIPLVIDNGSYTCRVGWATDEKPRLCFRNCYTKQRKDRTKKPTNGDSEILIANNISNVETGRFQLKSQHDENVVTHFENQELMFDYTFSHLGVNTSSVNHPIILTEAFCNPNYARQCMSELLFECYEVPKVSYVVDGLLSYHENSSQKDGIIISIGNCTTHIIPIIDHMADVHNSRRIRIGGHNLTKFLLRWLQLRFPQHFNAITLPRAEEIILSHMRIAGNYSSEIMKWTDPQYCEKFMHKIQLPFSAQPVNTVSAEQVKERKKEAAKRLADINAKKREEKLEEDLNELARLTELEEAMEEFTPDEAEYQHALDEAQVSSLQLLQRKTSLLKLRIEKTRAKISLANSAPAKEEEPEEPLPKKLCVSAPTDKFEREKWIEDIKQQWRDIQARKATRRNRRQEMAKRRTAASQERMRIISQLAKREKKEDNFGMNDEDWDVYKAINKDGGGSDSEDDDEKLQDVESLLKHHSPLFLNESQSKPISLAENYQLFLTNEMIRIGELFFQPSMCGLEQGGITETLDYIVKLYPSEVQSKLVNNVFMTGAAANLPGFKTRMETDLLAMRPFESSFNISLAKNPELDAWFGARNLSSYILENGITKQEYEEYGGCYLKENKVSNKYWAPISSIVEVTDKEG